MDFLSRKIAATFSPVLEKGILGLLWFLRKLLCNNKFDAVFVRIKCHIFDFNLTLTCQSNIFNSLAVGVRYCLRCRYGRCAAILEFFLFFLLDLYLRARHKQNLLFLRIRAMNVQSLANQRQVFIE